MPDILYASFIAGTNSSNLIPSAGQTETFMLALKGASPWRSGVVI